MKKFILSDLHIGHPQAQYNVMEQAISYIRQKAEPGDQIWGLGDWFHMTEEGFDYCIGHAMTQKFRDLAGLILTNLVPGNHDYELGQYGDNPGLVNPIGPINIIKPFGENGIWYCHGHEYDPVCEYLPTWFHRLWAQLMGKRTPGLLRGDSITEPYLAAVNLVHSRALLELQEKGKKEGRQYKGIVLGHTHLPLQEECPELPFLLNSGDMRDSSTFVVNDDTGFHLMQWDSNQSQWRVTSSLKA